MVALLVVALVLVAGMVTALVVVTRGGDDPEAADPGSSVSPSPDEPGPSGSDSDAPGGQGSDAPDTDATIAADRDAAVAAASTFVTEINTYGPDDLAADGTMPGYRERVSALLTPEFAETFEQAAAGAEQTVAQGGSVRTSEITAAGMSRLGDDEATALVAAVFEGTVEGAEPTRTPSRLRVTLRRDGDRWLVADFAPTVQAASDAAGDPSDRVESAGAAAREAAVAALPVVLSYDHRTLDADLAAARDLLTDDFTAEFDQSARSIEQTARQRQVTMVTTVLDAGLVSVGETTVEVLLPIDARTTFGDAEARTTSASATVTLELVDGRWLVDGLTTG